jgi:hypothetical protein
MRSLVLVSTLLCAAVPLTAQRATPDGWLVRVDGAIADTISHVEMPPGWHMTTGPRGAVLYHPSQVTDGRFVVESQFYLFPGTSGDGHGLFIGGRGLDGTSPSYLAFLVRRDGSAAVFHMAGAAEHTLVPWTRQDAVARPPAEGGTADNLLRVAVEPDSIRFSVNGARVATLPRGDAPVDGLFGFRLGAGINLHASQLDVTRRLAPFPARRPAPPR